MSTASDNSRGSRARGDSGSAVFLLILRMLLMPAIGAGIGYLLVAEIFIPHVGLGEIQRVLSLGKHLDAVLAPAPCIAFIGDSITREGVDARLVAEAGPPGWHAQNLAISACGLSEVQLILPKVLAAQPAAVAIGFRPEDLGCFTGTNLNKAYAYALAGFMEFWPRPLTRAEFPGIGDDEFRALSSNRFEQLLHFRTAPLVVFSDHARLWRNSEIRLASTDNWIDPSEMSISIRDARLDLHISNVRTGMKYRLHACPHEGVGPIAKMAHEIRVAHVVPILVIVPLHPQLRSGMERYIDALRVLLARVARDESGIVIDALDLLSADQFADAQHPNAEGRNVYSQFLGEQLRVLSTQGLSDK